MEDALRGREVLALRLVDAIDLEGRTMRLEDVGAQVLAQTPHLTNLRVLTLRYQLIRREGLTALLASPFMAELRELYLDGNLLGDEGMKAMARSAPWPQLVVLSLKAAGLAKRGLATLLDSSLMLHVRRLDVSRNDFGWGTGQVLATRAERMRRLEHLGLSRCGFVISDAQALGHLLGTMESLRSISLDENAMGDTAMASLLKGATASGLTAISARSNHIEERALGALAGIASLRAVELGERALPTAEMGALAGLPELHDLKLSHDVNAITGLTGDELPALRCLALRDGRLTVETLQHLAASSWFQELESLAMDAVGLTSEHVQVLVNVAWTRLRSLSLKLNQLEDDAIRLLAESASLATLEVLQLDFNNMTKAGEAMLASSPHLRHVARHASSRS